MTKLITDTAKLTAYITSTMKTYKSNGERVHVAFVSALYHAATTGQNALLNRVYSQLRSNDQSAVKLFVRRAHIINGMILAGANDPAKATPEGLETEALVALHLQGQVLDIVKGEFVVTNGHTSAQAKGLAKLCTDRFAEPDGEIDRLILDRNNFAEVKTLGDAQVLEQLIKLAKSIEGSTETKRVNVSQNIIDMMTGLKDKAETMLGQLTLAKG